MIAKQTPEDTPVEVEFRDGWYGSYEFVKPCGKKMPVDADTVEADDDELDLSRHQSHFSTCPNAGRPRRRG